MFAGNICQRSHWISVYNSPQEHKYISSHEHKYNSLGEHKYKYLQLLHHRQYHKIANIGLISYELKSSIHIILIFIALPISILSCFIITQYTNVDWSLPSVSILCKLLKPANALTYQRWTGWNWNWRDNFFAAEWKLGTLSFAFLVQKLKQTRPEKSW